MRKINLVEPATPAWAAWKARCAVATAAVIATAEGGGKPVISDLYKEQKSWFLESGSPFGGKCAYCEKKINSTQRGDVEHYRPKLAVQNVDWSPVRKEVEGLVKDHPGYYWLAYEISNLLLSCIFCNQVYLDRLFGKGNRFPVEGQHGWAPGDETGEIPLLLNPCVDEPKDHLAFDTTTGIIGGKTNSGEVTVDILGLNLRDLPRERLHAFEAANDKLDSIMAQRRFRGSAWVQERLQDFANDDAWDFSSVTKLAVQQGVASILRSVEGIAGAA